MLTQDNSMTIRVKIGAIERDIGEADSYWINEQINRLQNDGVVVCVQVFIEQESVRLRLATYGCQSVGGGNRALTPQENEIVTLWKKLHLDSDNFTGGNLVAFLKQIRR